MASNVERILILAKTYPSPSAKYTETSCVAGINEAGQVRRIFPVPFRMIAGEQQFKKWQWISARIEKSSNDHRPESHRIFVDTIEAGEFLGTEQQWAWRRHWMEKLPLFPDFGAMDATREASGISLAILRPKRIVRLEIVAADNPTWTDEELAKLLQEQSQGHLFDQEDERKQLKLLKKMPFDFYYHYVCDTPEGERMYKHKIVDWEICMLFWNCKRDYGAGWEGPFRKKIETDFADMNLHFMMGNIHRFQQQWLIISLIYPPKPSAMDAAQIALF